MATLNRPGNPYLKAALGTAAMPIASRPNSCSPRIARHGRMKAIGATQHSILTAAWHMLAYGECYQDPGATIFTRRDPVQAKNDAVKRLNALGYRDCNLNGVTPEN
ncbi:hypothetical protein QFZ69_001886 [Arthrobacter sp. V1I7]|uniref:hypothetical protein n=1 Tax=Arthrobacter sp. V1I7 TaxID=3042274 RepID=UPI002784715B|nr:hypothetical protein [Arthrobacter sp. V1I7]MDQ0821007.1 hypothetical protein [Arthrobacter sp. V1I7]